MAIRKHWKKILLGVVIALVLVTTIGLPYAFARLVTRAGTRPMDLRLTTSPSDYDLDFENVSFTSADGVRLSGWYLGGASSDVAIACGHGLFRSRREVLDRAAFFRKQGYDTLVFDFRRHGESEGERVTLGFDERLDLLGAVEFLKEKKPGVKIVLYGVSMGAAAGAPRGVRNRRRRCRHRGQFVLESRAYGRSPFGSHLRASRAFRSAPLCCFFSRCKAISIDRSSTSSVRSRRSEIARC